MELNFKEFEGVVTGTLSGRLDTAEVQKTDISEFVNNSDKKIIFDCKDLQFISSAGLRLLLSLHKSCLTHGGSITLRSLDESIMRILKVAGFVEFFSFE